MSNAFFGFHDEDRPKHVFHLQKSLYGLKQSPRAWFKRLHDFLLMIGFCEVLFDSSLFIYNRDGVCEYLLVYVDNIVIISSSPSRIDEIISQ